MKLGLYKCVKGDSSYLLTGERKYLTYVADVCDKIYQRDRRLKPLRLFQKEIRTKEVILISDETMHYVMKIFETTPCVPGTRTHNIIRFFRERVCHE